MALGTVTPLPGAGGNFVAVEAMASVVVGALNGPPGSATAGLAVDDLRAAFGGTIPDIVTAVVLSTAGSNTMTATIRCWLMYGTLASLSGGAWCPAGIGTGTTKGVLNGGVAIDESGTDIIRHEEPIHGLHQATRVYFEAQALGGTATAVTVFLTAERATARAA